MKTTKMAFEQRYTDGSGVEFAVRYDANNSESSIEFESVDTVTFPIEKIDWLIECLNSIKRNEA